jgi:hypothetical protein
VDSDARASAAGPPSAPTPAATDSQLPPTPGVGCLGSNTVAGTGDRCWAALGIQVSDVSVKKVNGRPLSDDGCCALLAGC